MIAKVFRQADTEEKGSVDASIVPDLAAKVIGAGIRESEMHLIRFKAESKAGESQMKNMGALSTHGLRTSNLKVLFLSHIKSMPNTCIHMILYCVCCMHMPYCTLQSMVS